MNEPGNDPGRDGASGRDRRRAELAANLEALESRLAAACSAVDRRRDEVTLIAVTKTWPASDVHLLADLGIRHIGENRDQEAAPKATACSGLGLTWHFVGRLQTNKARSVASYADVVHSVDRARLVTALDEGAGRAGRVPTVLLQVDIGDDTGRAGGGAAPSEVPALAEAVAAAGGLELGGVMAIGPLGADPAPAFARLAEVAQRLRLDHPGATIVSAGMSGDLEQAIAAGATHVRVGTALLGARPSLR